jgi:hypothetical protein
VSRLKLKLVLNPVNKDDMTTEVTVTQDDRVFMRLFVVNESDDDVKVDQVSAEILANHGEDVLALAPTDCPHAGDLADSGSDVVCSVSRVEARSGGLQAAGDPSNGTELELAQVLMPDEEVGGFSLGTGKAGIMAMGDPFVIPGKSTMHLADGRSRLTGMIAAASGSTPVVALGFASLQGLPIPLDPAYARVTVTGPSES